MSEAERSRWRDTHAPARYWSARDGGMVQCHLSPRGCTLREGQHGFCGVRVNLGGELRSLNYGKSTRATQEFVETEAIYHYAPGARILSMGNLGCMMSCDYCHNWQTSQARHVRDRDVHHYTPGDVVERARALGVSILSWTYNDPVVWQEFVVDTARLARAAGILNLYKSAFYIQEEATRELCEHMDIFSLSLKSMDAEFYRKLTKGTLAPVLKAIEVVVASGRHLELSNLMVTGANDNEKDAELVARWVLDHCPDTTPLHFVRFHPDYKYTGVTRTPIDRLERAHALARGLGVKHVYVGNVAEHAGAHSYCSGCGQRVVTRYGMAVSLEGLSAEGRCTACGSAQPFRGLAVTARDRAARAVPAADLAAVRLHAAGQASVRHAWPEEILSAHVEADNASDQVVHVGWLREGAGDQVEAVAIPPRTTHRFVVARSGPAETAFRIGGPAAIRVFDLLDRAHFPTTPGSS